MLTPYNGYLLDFHYNCRDAVLVPQKRLGPIWETCYADIRDPVEGVIWEQIKPLTRQQVLLEGI